MKQSGNDYDPEWIEHQFNTQILPHCETRPDSHDLDAVENAFFACLKEGLAPKPVIDTFKRKLEVLLKTKTDAKQPTQAIRTCIDYLDFQIQKMIGANTFRNRLFVKGDSKDLELISIGLNLGNEPFQMLKHFEPPEKLTEEQMNSLLRGKTLRWSGITKLELLFNIEPEQLKQFILKKFPNVTFS
jgi:hypothetical protein